MKRVTLYLIADDFKRLFKPDFLIGRYFFIPLDMLSYHNSLFVDFYSTRTLKFFFEDISEENDRF